MTLYLIAPDEFAIKAKAKAISVRQEDFREEQLPWNTISADLRSARLKAQVRKLNDFAEEIVKRGPAGIFLMYRSLLEETVERLKKADETFSSTDAERAENYGEIRVCEFILNELTLMGVH